MQGNTVHSVYNLVWCTLILPLLFILEVYLSKCPMTHLKGVASIYIYKLKFEHLQFSPTVTIMDLVPMVYDCYKYSLEDMFLAVCASSFLSIFLVYIYFTSQVLKTNYRESKVVKEGMGSLTSSFWTSISASTASHIQQRLNHSINVDSTGILFVTALPHVFCISSSY